MIFQRFSLLLLQAIFLTPLVFADHSSSPLSIGTLYGLTGPLSDLSHDVKSGVELFQHHNPNVFDVKFEDTKWDAKTAVTVYRKLLEAEGIRFFHIMGSSPSLAVKPLAEKNRTLLITSGAHEDLLKKSSYLIRHANMPENDARILAQDILKRFPSYFKVAIVYIQSDWGESFQRHFINIIKKQNPDVIVLSESHTPEEVDFRSHITRLLSKKPEVIVTISTGSAIGPLIKQIFEMRYSGVLYANNGLVLSGSAITLLQSNGIKGFFYQRYPTVDKLFFEEYKNLHRKDPGYFALAAYTDYELLADALKAVERDPTQVANYIRRKGRFRGRYETIEISPQGDILVPTEISVF